MPSIQSFYVLEGSKYSTDAKSIDYSEVYIVQTDPGTNPQAVYLQALTCPGIPPKYSLHPVFTALTATKFVVEAMGKLSPSIYRVIVSYEYDYDHRKSLPSRVGKCTFEVGTAMAKIKATRDANGNSMILNFADPNNNNMVRQQPAEFDMEVPMPLIKFSRREPNDGFDYIQFKLDFEGHINSRLWNHGLTHSWMCTNINAKLEGADYIVEYQFQYHGNVDPGTWDGIWFFKEPTSSKTGTKSLSAGAPALDISVPNGGIQIFQVYPEVDFNGLNVFF